MLKKLHCILIVFLPTFIFAQSSFVNDSAFDKIVAKECDGKQFSRTEVLPSLKISNAAFADSLKLYLNSRNLIFKNRLATFKFFLTSHSQILNISMIPHPLPNQEFVSDAILHFADLWNPAVQNSHAVCADVILLLDFRGDKINIFITQQ